MVEYFAADTSVVSRLTKVSDQSVAYQAMLGERKLAVSFQVRAELLAAGYGAARMKRLEDLLSAMLALPHAESTDVWYSRIIERRRELKKIGQPGGDAGDADAWIISSSLEHGIPLLSHDIQQVHLGRAIGGRIITNLPTLRDSNPST